MIIEFNYRYYQLYCPPSFNIITIVIITIYMQILDKFWERTPERNAVNWISRMIVKIRQFQHHVSLCKCSNFTNHTRIMLLEDDVINREGIKQMHGEGIDRKWMRGWKFLAKKKNKTSREYGEFNLYFINIASTR
jgi:hypothetical protein